MQKYLDECECVYCFKDFDGKVACENCSKRFKPPNGLNRHIGQIKACEEYYGPRYENMKSGTVKERVQKSRNKHGIKKELKRQKEAYIRDPSKKRAYGREYYQENRETQSKAAREKAQDMKKNSDG